MGRVSGSAVLRYPRLTLLLTLLLVGVLGFVGLHVDRRLEPTSFTVPGTPSARGQALADAHFGESSPFVILLRGPGRAIDRQGPALARALRRDPDVTVLSPWQRGPAAALLPPTPSPTDPAPTRALLLVDFHLPLDQAIRRTVPGLQRTLAAHIHPPLSATQSGFASVSRALQDESLSATERAELICAPLLILVLLLVFRSALAAAIPLLLGAMTVLAGRGVLVILSAFMRVDALSLVVCTMMGLALGVDYSLLIVSRFRDELVVAESEALRRESDERRTELGKDAGREGRGAREILARRRMSPRGAGRSTDVVRDPTLPTEDAAMRSVRSRQAVARLAARRTRATAGRTTALAGSTLFLSIFASAFLQPGSLLVSLATALLVVTAIAVAIASLALPALLALLGRHINAGRLPALRRAHSRPASPRRRPGRVQRHSRVAGLATLALRRPGRAAALIAIPLLLLAIPAAAFNTGAPGVGELPPSNPARRSAETIDRAVGPGWEAPFALILAAAHGPIATPPNLALLARWSARIASQPGIRAVIAAPPRPAARAAALLVVPTAAFNTAASREIGARLLADSERIGREGHLQTGAAGGAATLNDYGAATRARLPLVIGSVVAITFLMLLAIFRAPLLAALTVVLNLASVAAAIGVISLVCKLPAGYPLGAHPYIDTVGAAAIFGITFGLSIDYAVFLLARMRERYDELLISGDAGPVDPRSLSSSPEARPSRTLERGRKIAGDLRSARAGAEQMGGIYSGDMLPPEVNRAAIHFGLDRTAGVITGAAAIMAAVFLAFAAAPIATVSQMGVGLTVAVGLDATVVRIVLLPALMLLLGDRVWAVPAWLDRILPHLGLHGGEPDSAPIFRRP